MDALRRTGTVARLFPDKVFGFLHCPEDKRDYFFHQSQLDNCTFGQLAEGDVLSFLVGETPKGLEAQEIRREEAWPLGQPARHTRG